MDKGPNRSFELYSIFLSVSSSVLIYTLLGMGIAYLAYKKLNFPSFTVVFGALVGLTVAFYRIYQLVKKEMK